MKNILYSIAFSCFATFTFAQPTTWGIQFSNAIKTRYTPTINNMTNKGWEYSNSIITHGMEKIYDKTPDASYLNYIKAYIDLYVTAGGGIPSGIISLDKIHPGISVLFLYEKMKSANNVDTTKYKTAALNLRNILVGPASTYPKTSSGGIFWHKNNGSYNNIVLLDGVYMAHPFLAKYGRLFNDNAAMDTAINQIQCQANHPAGSQAGSGNTGCARLFLSSALKWRYYPLNLIESQEVGLISM